ncbi:MAG: hypothetical protein WBL05_04265 [Brooklawnia sp.]|uniref:hypothetical protein n=1 Tax=Brooklawnia sp. TaxID=2699740 RepID=UPI003C7946CF
MKQRDYHETCHGHHPQHPDGGEWNHVMVLHDGSTVYADTAAEVLSELLPGYQELDAQARRRTRIRHAQQVAGLVQRLQLEQAIAQGEFDQSDPGQAALADILTTDKSVSLGLELPDAPGRAADWLPQLPLVLVTTNYAPHTRYPRVGGNVVWIDPADEVGYLASLHRTGVFSYWTSAAPATA